jgi:hypothetical protein
MLGQTAVSAPSPSISRRRALTSILGIQRQVRLRMAVPEDVPELTRIFNDYYQSSDWQNFIDFDVERCADYLEQVISIPIVPHILAEERGPQAGIVGVLSYELVNDFSKKPIVTGHTFWVRKDYHPSALARYLVDTFLDLARIDGASVIHLPVMSNLTEARSLKNLLLKKGFHEMGYVMRKGL